jgi:hypothetical protein
MPEVDYQNFSTVQSLLQPKPGTLASATTVAPTGFLTILTGNVVIATITPPLTGVHMIALQFAGTAGVNAAGNITAVKASVLNEIMLLVYNPNTAKYTAVG